MRRALGLRGLEGKMSKSGGAPMAKKSHPHLEFPGQLVLSHRFPILPPLLPICPQPGSPDAHPQPAWPEQSSEGAAAWSRWAAAPGHLSGCQRGPVPGSRRLLGGSLDCLHGRDTLRQQHWDYGSWHGLWTNTATQQACTRRRQLPACPQANMAAQNCRAGRQQLPP